MGADVRAWYAAMPRPTRLLPHKRPAAALPLPANAAAAGGAAAAYAPGGAGPALWGGNGGGVGGAVHGSSAASAGVAAGGVSGTIDRYYLSRHCAACDALTHLQQPLCEACLDAPQVAAAVLGARAARLERQHLHLVRLCLHCGGGGGGAMAHGGVVCDSVACGVWYERRKVAGELRALAALAAAALEPL